MMSEECCIICGEHGRNLSECRDVKSCRTLCEAAEIRQHQRVLAQEVTENGLPNEIVKYHRNAGRHSHTKNSCIGLQKTLKRQ